MDADQIQNLRPVRHTGRKDRASLLYVVFDARGAAASTFEVAGLEYERQENFAELQLQLEALYAPDLCRGNHIP